MFDKHNALQIKGECSLTSNIMKNLCIRRIAYVAGCWMAPCSQEAGRQPTRLFLLGLLVIFVTACRETLRRFDTGISSP